MKTGIIAQPDKTASKAGYTLTELLVVLAIIALISAVLAPRLVRGNSSATAKIAATQLMDICRQARQAALTSGISQQVIIDTDRREAWLDGGQIKFAFHNKLDLETKTAEPESAPGLAGIRFFPDGGSTGGEVRFINQDSQYLVSVIWANGDIRVAKIE